MYAQCCVLIELVVFQYFLYNDYYYCLRFSEKVVAAEVPTDMEALVAEKRHELIEAVSEVDDKLAELFLADEPISSSDLEVSWSCKILMISVQCVNKFKYISFF